MDKILRKVINKFGIKGNLITVEENNQGNINTTFVLTIEEEGQTKKYIVQKINVNVFKKPDDVMNNMELVTNHLKQKMKTDFSFTQTTLDIVKTVNGKLLAQYMDKGKEKSYYRMYHHIDGCISYDTLKDCRKPYIMAYNTGKSFGMFHRALNDFPVKSLVDTIPNFHNTPIRFKALIESIENDVLGRAKKFAKEIHHLNTMIEDCSIIWENLGSSILYRVTHNDTKLNNVMFDEKTNEGRAIIDLDTTMPGSYLFDVGDGIKSTCANSFEDETDPEKIFLNLELTKAYLSGYLSEMFEILTTDEIKYIALSIKTLTFELAIRFLTDYINGDKYFKIKYPTHNADRFLNQYKLLCDIDSKLQDIQDFVFEYLKNMELKGKVR
ncbi:MAG: phosphotransferase [Mollicutes bacterium]|nr:phosphotransferase [Mollicutes bacterium]